MTIVAWQYGLLPPLADGEFGWDADCEREMALQVGLWNALVAIEEERRAAERAVLVADDPELAKLQGAFDAIIARLEALPRRPHSRMTAAERAGWSTEVSELRDQRKAAWAELKPRLAAARRAHAAALKRLADERYQAIAAARNASGLWWGNYNAVCAAFDTALGRLAPGDRLRRHEWNGDGRLTNQIMGGITAAALLTSSQRSSASPDADSPSAARARGGHAQVRIADMPEGHRLLTHRAGRAGRPRPGDRPPGERLKLLVATIHSRGRGSRHMASWPIILHRDFPPDAVVKTVAIHRRRVGAPLDPLPGLKRRHDACDGWPGDGRQAEPVGLALDRDLRLRGRRPGTIAEC